MIGYQDGYQKPGYQDSAEHIRAFEEGLTGTTWPLVVGGTKWETIIGQRS